MKNIFTKILALTLVLIMALTAIACGGTEQQESGTNPPYVEPPIGESDDSDETSAPDEETEAPVDTEKTTEEPVEDAVEDPDRIYNYLNGTTTTAEERDRRPVAIMINNIKERLQSESLSP